MAKHTNDVRALSADARYMHVVFSGTIDEALEQARAAPDHGLTAQIVPYGLSRSRAALLQHLNLLGMSDGPPITSVPVDDLLALQSEWEQGDKSMTWADFQRKPPARAPSPYSLEYAMSRWPENFQTQSKPPYRDIDDVFPSTWGLPS